ncbi:hypothetical protein [Actinomadura sp. NBRC 104412]|uniref:hypothetical protein n=1 Tax=Actinomadura sp. NBRC 104412 TaxID=3032203 RepID=UPI002555FCA9|nr:hypothetical protein [Actinomadura sp. NBRC 104412]
MTVMTDAASAPTPIPGPHSTPYTAPGPRLAAGIGPDGTYNSGGRFLAFLAGLWTMVAFFPLLFVGAVLYTKAEEIWPQDPERARRLVVWSWASVTWMPLVCAAVVTGVTLALSLL